MIIDTYSLKNKNALVLFLSIFLVILGNSVFAKIETRKNVPAEVKYRVLFILDASGSMKADWNGNQKLKIAAEILSNVIDSLEKTHKDVEFALRIFGHQSKKALHNCEDSKLEIPFASNNASKINKKLETIQALGYTPIAYSLQKAPFDFPVQKDVKNLIVLLTDGEENCDGDPCAAASQLQKNGINLKPYVIGMGLDNAFKETFECIGTYIPAPTPQKLKKVIQNIVEKTKTNITTQIKDNTTLQIHLLNDKSKSTQANIPIELYDAFTKELKYAFIHTFAANGAPDSIFIDGLNAYDIVIHSYPTIVQTDFVPTPNTHNVLKFPCELGELSVKMIGFEGLENIPVIIKNKMNEIVNIQNIQTVEKYLSGYYTIEINTLPAIIKTNYKIESSKLNEIILPKNGVLQLISNIGKAVSILDLNNNETLFWENKNVEGSINIELQPGNYKIIYRSNHPKESVLTRNIDITIESSKTKKLELN